MPTPAQSTETGLARAQSCTEGSDTPAREPFDWTEPRERAAQLLAEGELTQQQIADEVGVCRRTLCNWIVVPVFGARVRQLVDDLADAMFTARIASLHQRLQRKDEDWEALRAIIRARQEAAAEQKRLHEECKPEIARLQAQIDEILEDLPPAPDDPEDVDEVREAVSADIRRVRRELNRWTKRDPGPLHPGQETGRMVKVETDTRFGKRVEWKVDTGLLDAIDRLEDAAEISTGQRIQRTDLSTKGQPIQPVQTTVVFVLPPNPRDPVADAIDVTGVGPTGTLSRGDSGGRHDA